jgi:oligopeptide/dipeptide ABC transporter ATP-binding protein
MPASILKAVDGVSFSIGKGTTLGLVGESGCGKSSAGKAIIGLVKPAGGEVRVEGAELSTLAPKDERLRRRTVQMVFQDPASSLNPRMTVEDILAEPLEIAGLSRPEIGRRLRELLDLVALSAAHLSRYPHQFSGGQKQRIGIARALALSPRLVICDEPVSALDVSVQAQIINLLKDIQQEKGVAYLFIAHDLGVVRQISEDVAVMYLGRIVEAGSKATIYGAPKHPYTKALLAAAPAIRSGRATEKGRIAALGADLPNPMNPPTGCRFRTRCPYARQRCADEEPQLRVIEGNGMAACHFAETLSN